MGKKVKVQPVKIGIDTAVQVRLTEFGWSLYEDYFSTCKRPETVKGYLTMPLATLIFLNWNMLNNLKIAFLQIPIETPIGIFVLFTI